MLREQGVREDVFVSSEVGQEKEATCIGSSEPHTLGPLDKWARAIDPKLSTSEMLICVLTYIVGVAFNAIDNDEFKQMVEAIGIFGPGLKPPSQHDLRESLLKSEYARTKSLLKERDEENEKHGCSLMTDAWTDMKRRIIMNIVTHCAEGTSFIKSKDTSGSAHTSDVIFDLVDSAIEEVGADGQCFQQYGSECALIDKKTKHLLELLCYSHYQFDAPGNWQPTKVQKGT
ncbi:hypothetical protein LINPERPRIM_LOCUS21780 [Linum perenne]